MSAVETRALGAEAASLLDPAIDDHLLRLRGLVLVRGLLCERGATAEEITAHTQELERVRGRLVDLIHGG